jgi:hypothetical protein
MTKAELLALPGELAKLMSLAGHGAEEHRMHGVVLALLALKLYPEAKRRLVEQGMSPKEVEAMPVAQVMAIHSLDQFNYWSSELFKWHYLPYWQAGPHLKRTTRAFDHWRRTEGRMSLPAILLPALDRAFYIWRKSERQIAVLQTIEAVRMHAAAHDGNVPASLEDIRQVPTPLDPITGKPFVYKARGDTFTIEALAPPGLRARDGNRYIVTLRNGE